MALTSKRMEFDANPNRKTDLSGLFSVVMVTGDFGRGVRKVGSVVPVGGYAGARVKVSSGP